MKKICGGIMTLGQISGEVIYYIGLGATKVIVTIEKDRNGLFYAGIFVEMTDEAEKEARNLSVLQKLS
jgi:hypothetical protein